MRKGNKKNKGFSLVELIIVIAIMAILAGIIAPQYFKHVKNSQVSADIATAEQIRTAISAELAANASGTETVTLTVPDSDPTDWTAIAGTALEDITGVAGESKLESGSYFYYQILSSGDVKVGVGTDTSNPVELSPDASGDWK